MYHYYNIAGLTVKMNTFGRTADLAFAYRVEDCEAPDITIRANYTMVEGELPHVGADKCEYLATGRDFYNQLLRFDGMMLHASAIAVDGKAYLFAADSGVGKSTHTGLWRQVLGDDRVRIINDDKPALRLMDGVWYACGTPWSGKYGQNANLCCPVAGICLLERGRQNKIVPYEDNDIIFRFLKYTYRPNAAQYKEMLLRHIGSILEQVPVWKLECNKSREAAVMAYSVMSGGAEERNEK